MKILTTLKHYPATIISLLILLISLTTLVITDKVSAQNLNDCKCVNGKQCSYNQSFVANGNNFKCWTAPATGEECICNGPKEFTHCDRSYSETCKIPDYSGCSNPCINGIHCNPACETCGDCFEYTLSGTPCEVGSSLYPELCGNCKYKKSKV